MTARVLFLLALLTGCAVGTEPPHFIQEGNYLTFQHAFTEAAGAAARQRAEKLCGEQQGAAVKTSGVCSLTRCTTHYQCMEQEDAARALAPAQKK